VTETAAVGEPPEFRYRVFISYCHKDSKWAGWLHRTLESYKPPGGITSRNPTLRGRQKPLSPVFRDREELSSAASLSDAVRLSLEASANLVVVCSPDAARSRWVNEEILTFKRLGRSGRIFCFIVDGEPNSTDETECFPQALRYQWSDGGLSDLPAEPLAADARPGADGRSLARLKLIAGLLDVNLDELTQRDLQRRNRRLLAVTGGAVAIAILTVSLAIMAVLSKAEAQRRREQAENLIEFMVGDLNQRLQEIGRLDIFMSVGNKAMEYFSALHDEDVDDIVLSQRTKMLTQIGNTRLDQGEVSAALESFVKARAIALRLAESDPLNTEWQIALANSHFWLGLVHWQKGELEAAGEAFQKVIPIVDLVDRLEPGRPEWLAEKGYAYTNLARVLELQGELVQSLDLYKDIAIINNRLLELEPDNTDYRLEVGFAHNNIGKVVQSLGRLKEAEKHFVADLEIKQAVSESDPANNLWLSYLSTSYMFLGRNYMVRGEYSMAHDAYSSAVDIGSSLHRFDPENTEWSQRLAEYYLDLAAVDIQSGILESAQVALNESSKLWAELLPLADQKWSWRTGKGLTMVYQSLLALEKGDGLQSRTLSSTARAILADLHAEDLNNLESRKNLVLAGLIDGDAHTATDEKQAAITIWTEALKLLDPVPVADRDPVSAELSATLMSRLGLVDQASVILDRLDAMGYQCRFISTN